VKHSSILGILNGKNKHFLRHFTHFSDLISQQILFLHFYDKHTKFHVTLNKCSESVKSDRQEHAVQPCNVNMHKGQCFLLIKT
jgi:hypothetical protein